MKIVSLAITDYDKITQLWTRANLPFKPIGRDSREAMAAEMAAHPNYFLGVLVEDNLVGIVVLSSDLRKGWINRLAIDPAYRYQGIGQALIAESERIFQKEGIKIFCALIDEDNAASRNLFRKCGYVEHHDIIYFSKRMNDAV